MRLLRKACGLVGLRGGKFPIFLVSKGTSVEELFYMSLACSVGRKEERGRRGSPPSDSFLFSYLSYSGLLAFHDLVSPKLDYLFSENSRFVHFVVKPKVF